MGWPGQVAPSTQGEHVRPPRSVRRLRRRAEKGGEGARARHVEGLEELPLVRGAVPVHGDGDVRLVLVLEGEREASLRLRGAARVSSACSGWRKRPGCGEAPPGQGAGWGARREVLRHRRVAAGERTREKRVGSAGVPLTPRAVWAPTIPFPPKKFASRLYMCIDPPRPLDAPPTLPISSAMTCAAGADFSTRDRRRRRGARSCSPPRRYRRGRCACSGLCTT